MAHKLICNCGLVMRDMGMWPDKFERIYTGFSCKGDAHTEPVYVRVIEPEYSLRIDKTLPNSGYEGEIVRR